MKKFVKNNELILNDKLQNYFLRSKLTFKNLYVEAFRAVYERDEKLLFRRIARSMRNVGQTAFVWHGAPYQIVTIQF
jgi:hypothetical protein